MPRILKHVNCISVDIIVLGVSDAQWPEKPGGRNFQIFRNIKKLYLHAFDRMLKERERRGKEVKWKTAEEVFLWWMEDDNIPGQMSIGEYLQDD